MHKIRNSWIFNPLSLKSGCLGLLAFPGYATGPKYLFALLVNTIDCKSHCNVSIGHSTPMTSQRPATLRSLSLVSKGFIRVDRSPTGQCPRQQSCAVTLRTAPGQRINVTLWDFTMRDDRRVATVNQAHGVETCYRCCMAYVH